MLHKYRRRRGWGYERWHFARACRLWPTDNYEEVRFKPATRDICRECERLKRGWF